MKGLTFILTLLILAGNINAQEYAMSSDHRLDPLKPAFVMNEILVKFHDDLKIELKNNKVFTSNTEINKLLEEYKVKEISRVFPNSIPTSVRHRGIVINGEEKSVPNLKNIFRLSLEPGSDMHEIVDKLGNNRQVDFAEPNFLVYSIETYPDDPIYGTGAQWHIDTVKAPQAWDLNISDTNQVIAIIDTGVDIDHPDLEANIWTNRQEVPGNGQDDDGNGYIDDINGWDFINDDNLPYDDNSHGTHVAGIAAAVTDNATGIAGIAWQARIMPVKMLQSSGQGNSADFAAAIAYASENGATVINMSVGSYAESMTVKLALEYAYSNSFLIAAAGNDGFLIDYAPVYPAAYSFVLGVEASDFYNEIAFFSNFDADGPLNSIHADLRNYEIRAPGYGIYSTFPNGTYHALSGTSMSAPIVSGAAAILKSYHPGISHEQLFVRMIQGSNNQVLDICESMTMTPAPDLRFLDFSIYDTLPGCDRDGLPDAGENIVLNIRVRNYGALADSVWAHFRLGPYEDPSVAVITDSLSTIGNISAYANLHNQTDPFIIKIDSNLTHDRDIVFNCIISSKDMDTISQEIILTVQNAEELSGVVDTTLYLTPDKLWVVNSSFRISSTGHLIILPGTQIHLNKPVINWGQVDAIGNADSMVIVSGDYEFQIGYYNLSYVTNIPSQNRQTTIEKIKIDQNDDLRSQTNLDHCKFDGNVQFVLHNVKLKDCSFSNSTVRFNADSILRCNFYNVGISEKFINYYTYIEDCNFSRINSLRIIEGGWQFRNNNFMDCYDQIAFRVSEVNQGNDTCQIYPQFWGTTDTSVIDDMIWDFHDDIILPVCAFQPILTIPSGSAHGFPWKVHINDINPQDNTLDPIGPETVKFDVFFNRAMDTSHTPMLSFGPMDPFTSNVVKDNASWSSDSTIWTAYFNVGLETGDGLNYIRVADAIDDEGFFIPVEDNKRFFFTIQAAGANSILFNAYAGMGKIDLEWEPATTPDILGYSLYRYNNLTDSTYSDTLRLNTYPMTDSAYTDYQVIPDTTYHYRYTITGTDLLESDFSKVATAKPLGSIEGDANGDGNVNVLDITSIIDFILLNKPQPFLFDEADINNDKLITIADIVGVVNIIIGSALKLHENGGNYPKIGEILVNGNMISVNSPVPIKAMKVELVGEGLLHLGLMGMNKGFELVKKIDDDRITCIIYSLSGMDLPVGKTDILKLTDNLHRLSGIKASGATGDGLSVWFNEVCFSRTTGNQIEASIVPNPFSEETTIRFYLVERCAVNLLLVDLEGKVQATISEGEFPAGVHNVIWKRRSNSAGNIDINKGIYLLRIVAKSSGSGSRAYQTTKKVILN